MEMQDNKEKFSYTYSADEQEELLRIREKYQPKSEDKMDIIRKLDASVNKKATMCSIIVGLAGALIMGMGMSFTMTDIGSNIFSDDICMIIGIIIGIIGIMAVCLAYPLYNHVLKIQRKKIAPRILELTDELMK